MDRITLNALQGAAGAAGAAGGDKVYVEEVFSTYLFKSDNTAVDINNGIDLDTKGGMVWAKCRLGTSPTSHNLYDTERGVQKYLASQETSGEVDISQIEANSGLLDFNSDGFSLGQNYNNENVLDMATWTFRKAPGFFDVVTWNNGDSNAGTIPHNLGCKPGMIMVKATDDIQNWGIYHKSLGATYALIFTSDDTYGPSSSYFPTLPTSSDFTIGGNWNATGKTYVAYLFADGDEADAQIFGDGGDESIIKCGTFTIDGSGNIPTTNLGFEPQWILTKRTDSTGHWIIYDSMRGITTTGNESILYPNLTNAEDSTHNSLDLTSTGFTGGAGGAYSGSGSTYVYMAIRRGPMKTPEDATKVFAVDTGNSSQATGIPAFDSGFPVDAALLFNFNNQHIGGYNNILTPRLTEQYLMPNNTDDEGTGSGESWDMNLGWALIYDTTYQSLTFQRAPGFFDVVCYEGTGSARTVDHNLGVAPELMLTKNRDQDHDWNVYSKTVGNERVLKLNNDWAQGATGTNIYWNSTTPTSSVFTVRESPTNISGKNYIAYLFATLPGVSKVGSETVGSSAIEVNCGFTGGARFVLLKRTDAAGDWYLYDSLRGIGPGNDPYVPLNVSTAQVTNTDYIDALTTGFKINTSLPAGDYIYLAIA